jgi:hypothetical protein
MFYSERTIKAVRKPRACEGCGVRVEAGETAFSCAGHDDGQFWAAIYHPDCRRAEEGLNKIHDVRGGDDWMNLGNDMEWEDWPWLIEAFPTVAERMKITQARYDKVSAERERTRLAWAEIDRERRQSATLSPEGEGR